MLQAREGGGGEVDAQVPCDCLFRVEISVDPVRDERAEHHLCICVWLWSVGFGARGTLAAMSRTVIVRRQGAFEGGEYGFGG